MTSDLDPDPAEGPSSGPLGRWVACAFLVAAALSLAHLARFLYQSHLVLPYWDHWGTVSELQRLEGGEAPLRVLFSQHSEHRIAVPRLLLWADLGWFKGSGIALVLANVSIQGLHVALLAVLVRRLAPTPAIAWALIGAFTAAAFSLCQAENLVWGFQVQFVGVYACASAGALAVLKRREAHGDLRWLGAAVAAGVVATFCMANGVLVWPLLVGLTLALDRHDRRGAVTLVVAGAACATVYLVGFEWVAEHDRPASALAHPSAALSHWFAYLGNLGGKPLALVLGPVAALSAVAAGVGLARRSERPPAAVVALMLALFIMASAALTSSGRFSFGWHQALSSRYTTPTAVLWCLLALLAVERVRALRRRHVALGALALGAACVLTLMTIKGERARVRWQAISQDLREAAVAALMGAPAHQVLHPTPGSIEAGLTYLRARRLSAFAGPEATWLGAPLTAHFSLLPEDLDGGLDPVSPLAAGASLAPAGGSALGVIETGGLVHVLLVGGDGRVVGLGRVVGALASPPADGARFAPWRGWLRLPANDVSAYAIVRAPADGEPGLVARLGGDGPRDRGR